MPVIKRKIAILGAGYTGLSAAYRLLKKGCEVAIFEKENAVGGLAKGFKIAGWQWSAENSYHHWFTNDKTVLDLAKDLNHKVFITRPRTDVYTNRGKYPLDSAFSLLLFKPLPFVDRLRVGFTSFYMKLMKNHAGFEGKLALEWIKKFMGKKSTALIWNPLFTAKFGRFKNSISLVWFWARMKKRTSSLAYPQGGFQAFADRLSKKIREMGGVIRLNSEITGLKNTKAGCLLQVSGESFKFDQVISTIPSFNFGKITRGLPQNYVRQINSVKHLHAQVLILILNKPFMEKTYWLNITDNKFPFLVLVEHTNFMDSKFYAGRHILYAGNYLPVHHPYLQLNSKSLLKIFDPYLKKINPNYKKSLLSLKLSVDPFAQPVVTKSYLKKMPKFHTPLQNIYTANLDMVYPWDRGTNYAVELGQKIADYVLSRSEDPLKSHP